MLQAASLLPRVARAWRWRAPVGAAPSGGHLVLIGGGERPPEVMRAFVRLAGGPAAPIVLIPTASEDPTAGPERAAEFREQWGCTDVSVLEVRSCADASRADYVAAAERARGIYFLGGDQTRIVNAFEGSPLLAAIERAFRGGAALGGTSAGHGVHERADDHRRGGLRRDHRGQRRAVARAGVLPGCDRRPALRGAAPPEPAALGDPRAPRPASASGSTRRPRCGCAPTARSRCSAAAR